MSHASADGNPGEIDEHFGIAGRLVISEKAVEHQLRHIYNKLDVSSRTADVVFAVQDEIVT